MFLSGAKEGEKCTAADEEKLNRPFRVDTLSNADRVAGGFFGGRLKMTKMGT